jgi:cell division protein ZapA
MPSTEVYILGQKYTIKGEAPEEHIQSLARYIDERIKEVCSKYPNITPVKALILTLFNIADELHRLKAEQEDIARHIEEKTDLLAGLFE